MTETTSCRSLPAEPCVPVTWYTAPAIYALQKVLWCCEFGDDSFGGGSIELVTFTVLREFQRIHEAQQLNWYTTLLGKGPDPVQHSLGRDATVLEGQLREPRTLW